MSCLCLVKGSDVCFPMLKTFDISPLEGRVCYFDLTGKIVTVECYARNLAFRFKPDFIVNIGDWLRFEGKIRAGQTRNRVTGKIDGCRQYYHDPYDGSPREHWIYFDLLDAKYAKIGPIELVESLLSSVTCINSFMDDWEKHNNPTSISSAIDTVQNTLDALYKARRLICVLAQEKAAKAVAIPVISPDEITL